MKNEKSNKKDKFYLQTNELFNNIHRCFLRLNEILPKLFWLNILSNIFSKEKIIICPTNNK